MTARTSHRRTAPLPGPPQPDPQLWPADPHAVEALRFRRVPLLWATLLFAAGELLARHWVPSVLLIAAAGASLALLAIAMRHSSRLVLAPLGVLWVGTGLWCAQIAPSPATQTDLAPFADGLSRTVEGSVVRVRALPPPRPELGNAGTPDQGTWGEMPDEETTGGGALQVDLAVQQAEYLTPDISAMHPAHGGVRVTLSAPEGESLPALRCGDVVTVPLRLHAPRRYRDGGAWQYADYLLAQGIRYQSSARADQLRVLGRTTAGLRCNVFALQSWASGRVERYASSTANRSLPPFLRFTPDDAAMLNAMLFGDRTGLTHRLRLGFERTGSFHLFVVSGMHVALVAGGLFVVLRRFRLHPWLSTLLTLAVTAGYAVLTGFAPPVERALAMTAVFLVARLLSRERSALNALGAAALAVLVWSPGALIEASFQMTFLALIAIAGIAVPLGERSFLSHAGAARHLGELRRDQSLRPQLAQFRVMLRLWGESLAGLLGRRAAPVPAAIVRGALWAVELALIGIVAELVMALPMSVYFHRATPFALPANFLSVPLIAVLVPLALLTFFGSLAGSWCAVIPGAVTAAALHLVRWLIGRLSGIAVADVRVPAPSPAVVVCALAAWVFCCWAVRRSGRWAMAAAAILPLVAVLVLWPERPQLTPDTMEVTAIDVGQGDSIFVAGADGRTLLVDAGGPVGGVDEAAAATSAFDVGEEVVAPYLWSRRLRRLDVVALTHAHSDHMGGMPAVLRDLRPRELWVGVDSQIAGFAALLAEAKELGIGVQRLRAGQRFLWGEQEITVLAPAADYSNPGAPRNDDSLVLEVRYGKASVLLEGDAEAPSERAMVAGGALHPVTLLKVGHHGSRTSTTPEFLAATAPDDAVISVGTGNTFGHPRPEIIARLALARARVFRTDQFGLTTFLLGRDGSIREKMGAYN